MLRCDLSRLSGLAALSLWCGGAWASVPEGWVRYQGGDYAGALREYRAAWEADPENTDAMYGMVNALTLLHRYAEADSFCDRLDRANAPAPLVQQKRAFIRRIHSLNHRFGFSLDGGPLLYSSAFIREPSLRYAYGQGRFGDAEAWFTWNQSQTFSISVSHFQAAFRADTVWSEIAYLDTLYRSLNQTPATAHYAEGDFTNQFGQADHWYSDYAVPVRPPPAARQNQIRAGWSGTYSRGALTAGLTAGESNLAGQKRLLNLALRQTWFLPWFDAGCGENAQQLDDILLLQASPTLARGYRGAVLALTPTFIALVKRDSLQPLPVSQLSVAARLGREGRIWSWSLDGAWGPRAFISTEDGRVLSSIALRHRQSYGAGLGIRPWGIAYLKFYALYKWEEYSQMDRHIAMSGMACQW